MKKKILAVILVSALSLSVVSHLPASAASKKKIKLNKKSITLNIGGKSTIRVTSKSKVKWKTSNKRIAVVSEKGIVTAKATGNTKITAYQGNQKAVCAVKVNDTVKNSNLSKETPAPTETPGNCGCQCGGCCHISPTPVPVQKPTSPPIIGSMSMEANYNAAANEVYIKIANGTNDYVYAGYYFTLEKFANNSWNNVPFKDGGGCFPDGFMRIDPYDNWLQTIALNNYFEPLNNGKYRVMWSTPALNAEFTITDKKEPSIGNGIHVPFNIGFNKNIYGSGESNFAKIARSLSELKTIYDNDINQNKKYDDCNYLSAYQELGETYFNEKAIIVIAIPDSQGIEKATVTLSERIGKTLNIGVEIKRNDNDVMSNWYIVLEVNKTAIADVNNVNLCETTSPVSQQLQ